MFSSFLASKVKHFCFKTSKKQQFQCLYKFKHQKVNYERVITGADA